MEPNENDNYTYSKGRRDKQNQYNDSLNEFLIVLGALVVTLIYFAKDLLEIVLDISK